MQKNNRSYKKNYTFTEYECLDIRTVEANIYKQGGNISAAESIYIDILNRAISENYIYMEALSYTNLAELKFLNKDKESIYLIGQALRLNIDDKCRNAEILVIALKIYCEFKVKFTKIEETFMIALKKCIEIKNDSFQYDIFETMYNYLINNKRSVYELIRVMVENIENEKLTYYKFNNLYFRMIFSLKIENEMLFEQEMIKGIKILDKLKI